MIKRHYRFAELALQLAREAKNGMNFQLCAVLVRKNRLISVGYNSWKTHPKAGTKMGQLHAEMDAILKCDEYQLREADLIVARARKSGLPGMAKPCKVCRKWIERANIGRVFYTTTGPILKIEELAR